MTVFSKTTLRHPRALVVSLHIGAQTTGDAWLACSRTFGDRMVGCTVKPLAEATQEEIDLLTGKKPAPQCAPLWFDVSLYAAFALTLTAGAIVLGRVL